MKTLVDLQKKEIELSNLLDSQEIADLARKLALEYTLVDPEFKRQKIEKYASLAAQSFLDCGRPAAAIGSFVWLKTIFPLSESVDRLARHLAQSIGRSPPRHSAPDEALPVPTPFQELKARVSFEEFGSPDEIHREHLIKQRILGFPLLNQLRSVEVLKLLETARYISLQEGESLFQEASSANAIYLVSRGGLELRSTSQLTRPVMEGEFLGDISYFLCSPHSGTAIASSECELVCFPRQELQACFEQVPRLHQSLIDWVYRKIFIACSPQSLIFRSLSTEKLLQVWDYFTPIHVPAGRVLMEPERVCDRFFIILKGRIEVLREGQPSVRVGPGHFVGERGLILQKQRSAKLVCLSDCHLLECDEWTYNELCDEFPEIRQSIESRRQEIESYQFSSKNFILD